MAQRDVAKEVQTACTHAAESLIFGGAFAAAAAGYRQYVLEVALQSYVHQHIYESVWRHVRREQRKKDDAFAQHLLALAASPTHTKGKIGVPHDLRGDLAPIVELLATLDTYASRDDCDAACREHGGDAWLWCRVCLQIGEPAGEGGVPGPRAEHRVCRGGGQERRHSGHGVH